MNTNLVAVFEGTAVVALSSKKPEKVGSFARAIAFADRQSRFDLASRQYAVWLANGQYRPLVNDVIDVMLGKEGKAIFSGMVGSGPISKDRFVDVCRSIKAVTDAKGKEVKGQKAFFYGLIVRVLEVIDGATVEAA